jgi:hypothetical protein
MLLPLLSFKEILIIEKVKGYELRVEGDGCGFSFTLK